MKLLKRLIGLMSQRATKEQYYLEIGTYFLKKGAGFQVGQVIKERRIRRGLWKVKVITGLFYDFHNNRINHTSASKVIRSKKYEKGKV